MAKYLGIDVGSSYVRAVSVRTSYRRIFIEAMRVWPPASNLASAFFARAAAASLRLLAF